MELDKKEFGRFGEQTATEYYRRAGYHVLATNYRCKAGEIDLVVSRGRELVFVEVKSRRDDSYGKPAEAVGPKKMHHLRQTAACYLKQHRCLAEEVRFDIIEITLGHIKGVG